jgi:chemotaxis protein CheX
VTSTARATLAPEDVVQVVDDIVGAFLGARATTDHGGVGAPLNVVACVHVTGSFYGSVICSVTERFAALCAERMLDVDISEVDDTSVVDAIGEIVNMIGGSLKALLPEPSVLSLPVVTLHDGQKLMVPGTATVASVDLRCADEPLQIVVLQRLASD